MHFTKKKTDYFEYHLSNQNDQILYFLDRKNDQILYFLDRKNEKNSCKLSEHDTILKNAGNYFRKESNSILVWRRDYSWIIGYLWGAWYGPWEDSIHFWNPNREFLCTSPQSVEHLGPTDLVRTHGNPGFSSSKAAVFVSQQHTSGQQLQFLLWEKFPSSRKKLIVIWLVFHYSMNMCIL